MTHTSADLFKDLEFSIYTWSQLQNVKVDILRLENTAMNAITEDHFVQLKPPKHKDHSKYML